MRIAFCIYGQIRDEHLSFPQIEAIARANDATVFLSTWRKRGSKTTGALETSQLSRIFGPEVGYTMPRVFFDRLFEAFPTLHAELQAAFSTAVTAEAIEAALPGATVEIEDGDGLFGFTRLSYSDVNSLRMLYKMWRSYLMMKDHERRTGTTFDLVALFRPDVVPPAVVPALGPGRLGVVQHHHGFIHDMFMLGRGEAIDAVMGLFGKCAMNASRPWRGIHAELHDHAIECGLAPEIVAISAWITDSGDTQARGRAILRRLLEARAFDRSFQPRVDWDEVAAVLLQTIAIADRSPTAPSLDEAPAAVRDEGRDTCATEAAFSMIGFAAEAAGRCDLAFFAETCRIVAAIEKDGLQALVKLRDWILLRWRDLAARAGLEPRAAVTGLLEGEEVFIDNCI